MITAENLSFALTILNEDIPDVKTIYFFFSIEQNKKNCLEKLPGVLVSDHEK